MKETETQKNWNDLYGNTHPKSDNFSLWPIIIVLVCILSVLVFYKISNSQKNNSNSNNDYSNNYNYSNSIKETETETNEDIIADILDNVVNSDASNKNGIIMKNSISTISDILHNIKIVNDENLNEYIDIIKNLDLSSHYDEFKLLMCKKINYLIKYNTNYNDVYFDLYKEIDYIEELAKAFDAAGVEYIIFEDENKIKYWYYDK